MNSDNICATIQTIEHELSKKGPGHQKGCHNIQHAWESLLKQRAAHITFMKELQKWNERLEKPIGAEVVEDEEPTQAHIGGVHTE